MNTDAFRQFYEYHFTEDRKIWDSYITPLSYDLFTQRPDLAFVMHIVPALAFRG